MARVAMLGLGAMGSRMAARLLAAGHVVTVWNRSSGPVAQAVATGALSAATPRDAVRRAEHAFVMVRDDAASRAVWLDGELGALTALPPGATAIDCSTLSLAWVRELARAAAGRSVAFVDAPVAGSRPQAETGQLVFLIGGEAETVDRVWSVLGAMGTVFLHAGPNGAGAALKLAVNALLAVQVAALAEILPLLGRAGVDAAKGMEVLGATPVCSLAAKGAGTSMLAGDFAPLFPVELVLKDLGYVLDAAGAVDATPVTAAVQSVFAEAVHAGMAADNMTGIIRLRG